MWHESFAQLLENSYEKLKNRNARYSRRAFAKKLGVSSGMLSDVANKKARFTKERALAILENLDLTPKEKTRMRVLLGKTDEIVREIPASDQYLPLYEWQMRAILFAYDLEQFEVTPAFLSQKLNLPVQEVQARIDNLISLQLLERNENNQITRPKVIWRVSDNAITEFVHKLYENNIELARQAIKAIPAAERDFTTITFAGNSAQFEKLRVEIQALYEKTFSIMEQPETNEIYQMSVLVHPLLRSEFK